MSWKATNALQQRLKFIEELRLEEDTMAELCREYGISRKTGHKWRERYEAGGSDALEDQSRAPHKQANAVPKEIRKAVLSARIVHQRWGPRTLHQWLRNQQPDVKWPSASTISEMLQTAGLSQTRGKRQWIAPTMGPLKTPDHPNETWCADFKGNFQCQDGSRCGPLTISDNYSRYLLRCQRVPTIEGKYVRAWFETAFREYGLPEKMRTDNGAPFASIGLAGLSTLSLWWIKLGIVPERIQPGKPQQNGRHERMHRTLKECTASPAAKNLVQQQRRFNQFRREYNEERPHQALEMKTPASLYTPSPRRYPARVKSPEYGSNRAVRTVSAAGQIRWNGEKPFVSGVLIHEPIGLEEVEDGIQRLWYGDYPIGWLNERRMQVSDPDRPPKGSRAAAEKAEQKKRATTKGNEPPEH